MKRSLVTTFTLALGLSAFAPPAAACGGAIALWRPVRPQVVQPAPVVVADAEKKLEEGNQAAAGSLLARRFPKLKATTPGADPLMNRALRIAALATVRGEGAELAGGATGDAKRAKNLEWAVGTLRSLASRADTDQAGDPSLTADVGEALAHVEGSHAEAFALLHDLARRDLMGSPYAYAALARLEHERGDDDARDDAVKHCTTMGGAPLACSEGLPFGPPAAVARN